MADLFNHGAVDVIVTDSETSLPPATAASINRNNLMMDMSWEELNRAQALSLELYRRVENVDAPKLIAPEAEE